MKTKIIVSLITFLLVSNTFAQSNLNQYKYVIVPNKFDFLKEENKYRLNELAQFLFEKHGFSALMEGSDYPQDLTMDRCLALRSNVIKGTGMFKTKLNVVLKDCNDRVVYTSEVGESREKEFKTAYNIALRAAFDSFKALNYKYEPKNTSMASQPNQVAEEVKAQTQEEIKKLKQEIETLKKEPEKVEEKRVEVNETPLVIPNENKVDAPNTTSNISPSNVLYAQAIDNGFQLVDSSPKVIYKIKNTGVKDVFLVEGKSAIVYKNGNGWILEYHTQNTKIVEELNIKF
ncbi:hypothetical protein EYD45_13210 [Hyunsoonleella flava]|uniref:Uncharacterized protein n=1 Tax=Hyunsoonleella flava TaxID=2527939 RepID=A0A4Q9FHQ7_9FLAO|nr:hypothetical protein [Hyunsoonleella flava]TBN01359.1 hypothetical protein EYD45_13210 [Hyunsoonleella flava]